MPEKGDESSRLPAIGAAEFTETLQESDIGFDMPLIESVYRREEMQPDPPNDFRTHSDEEKKAAAGFRKKRI